MVRARGKETSSKSHTSDYCGDGKVEKKQSTEPAEKNVEKKQVDVVLLLKTRRHAV